MSAAYNKGRQAFVESTEDDPISNPFKSPKTTWLAKQWDAGWNDAAESARESRYDDQIEDYVISTKY